MRRSFVFAICCVTRVALGQTPAGTNWRALYLKDLSAARAIAGVLLQFDNLAESDIRYIHRNPLAALP